MRFFRLISVLGLLTLAVLFAAGNLWFAAARSTIPFQMDGRVTDKRRIPEKIVGVDDVYFITVNASTRFQVDESVYNSVALNEEIHKDAWSRNLAADGKAIDLEWSRDFTRLLVVMPSLFVLCVILGALVLRPPPQSRLAGNSDESMILEAP